MAAQLVAELRAPFEIDAACPAASRRDGSWRASRRRPRRRTSPAPFSTTVRQQPEQAIEAPIGDRRHIVLRLDDEAPVAGLAAGRDGGDLADVGDDSGEHVRSLGCAMPGFQHVAAERAGSKQACEPGRETELFAEPEVPTAAAAVRRPAAAAPGTRCRRSTRSALQEGRRHRRRRLRPARASGRARQAPAQPQRRRRCPAPSTPPRSPRRRIACKAARAADRRLLACRAARPASALALTHQLRVRRQPRLRSSTMRTGDALEARQAAGQLRIVGQRPCRCRPGSHRAWRAADGRAARAARR